MSQEVHEFDTTINDLQFSPDRTYFITAGKDKSAKVGSLFAGARNDTDYDRYALAEILAFSRPFMPTHL